MTSRINSEAPNFTAETTEGFIDFHQWIGNGEYFIPVCTRNPASYGELLDDRRPAAEGGQAL
jgi:hypothetical protein